MSAWLAEMLRRVVASFDRAACTSCDALYVRWVVVDGPTYPEAVEHRCSHCPLPPGTAHVVDLGRDQIVTCTELDRRAERYWAMHRSGLAWQHRRPTTHRAPRSLRPAVVAYPHPPVPNSAVHPKEKS